MSIPRCVVFDTSTLVSAALRVGSVPHRAVFHALSKGEVCVSTATLTEMEHVLQRPKFDRYQPISIRSEFAAMMRENARLCSVSEADEANVAPVCRDPKDNKFLALARVCDAAVLISSDADLLVMHPWQSVSIITPAAFVALLQP